MSPGINAASFAAVLSHTDAGLPRWRKCPAESSNLFGTSVNPRLAGEDARAVLWNGNFERDRIKTF